MNVLFCPKMNPIIPQIALILAVVGIASASPGLRDVPTLRKAIGESGAVVKATVISRTEEWTASGRVVSEAQAKEIYRIGSEKQKQIFEKHGPIPISIPGEVLDPEELKAQKAIEDYYNSSDGKEWVSLSCRIIVSLRLDETLTRELPEQRKETISCAWTISFGLMCPHVGVAASAGDHVVVFLKGDWADQVVLNPKYFQIGAGDLEGMVNELTREVTPKKPQTEQDEHSSPDRSESK